MHERRGWPAESAFDSSVRPSKLGSLVEGVSPAVRQSCSRNRFRGRVDTIVLRSRALFAVLILAVVGCRRADVEFEATKSDVYDEQDVRCVWPPDRAKCFGAVDLLVQGPSDQGALVLIGIGPFLRGVRVDEVLEEPDVVPVPYIDRLTLPRGWHRIVIHGVDEDRRVVGRPETRWVQVVEANSPFELQPGSLPTPSAGGAGPSPSLKSRGAR